MNRLIRSAIALVLGSLSISVAPAHAQAAARHYDCSKAGNANKAVCKAATPAVVPKSAPTASPKACRDATGHFVRCGVIGRIPDPGKTVSSTSSPERHYDCSKAGNANKAVCKGTVATLAPTAAAPRVAPAPAPHAAVVGQNTHPGGPNGATAKCKDGTLSTSAHRSGTCSRHGGVAQWY